MDPTLSFVLKTRQNSQMDLDFTSSLLFRNLTQEQEKKQETGEKIDSDKIRNNLTKISKTKRLSLIT